MPDLLTRVFLRDSGSKDSEDKFPARQLFILALCRLCEPIAFMSTFPYAYRMVESFNITQDETQISVYAGMLITAFAFAEFSTGTLWGSISDRIGRKPVLIMGLFGTALSMISFGFARSLPTAIMARALGGLLNGNSGVLQTTVAELVTKKEHQAKAYAVMPFIWSVGSIIGPAIGGALAVPCGSHQSWCTKGNLFDTYPFLLPNLCCVLILCAGMIFGIMFLEETHSEKKHHRDLGLELGRILLGKTSARANANTFSASNFKETSNFADSAPPPGYRSTESSPLLTSTSMDALDSDLGMLQEKEKLGTTRKYSKHVVLIILGYAILAYHSVSFDALMPTFLSEDRMQTPAILPFKFSGGFGLSTQAIGYMLAVQGVYAMFAQMWLFPLVVRRLGNLRAYRLVLTIWPFLYLAVPYLVLLPEHLQKTGIYFCMMTKMTFHVISFPSNAILLANAVPSRSVLGSINGSAASAACFARAFGPVVTGSIHSVGLKLGYNGLAWWACGIVCAVGALESYWMEEGEGRLVRPSEQEEQNSCEPLLHATAAEPTEDCTGRSDSIPLMDELDLTKALKQDLDIDFKH
ncbi:major facilitator superfamily domain-containing protein [Exophiala viscosa]|uniref:major facilitator superfamily domain-containing protein n=1 Tax=Exophiala viscosa TaxID=2486360 RepID=UPI00219DE8BE|nr:major facilitator superfamily domain-containing protein [Exophiala viscosa]